MQESVQCKHFVMRKKRFCRMTVKRGQEYCGEHLPSVPEESTEKFQALRVVCPLDSKHTCYANKLKQHLKKCNAKEKGALPYIAKGVNAGEGSLARSSVKISEIPKETLMALISRINKIHEEIIANNVSEKIATHDVIKSELTNDEYGNETKKHLVQVASIVGLLSEYDLLTAETCYIEFGAGKGKLSYWISNAVKDIKPSSVVLIERASPRHKCDNKLDKTEFNIHRIRADISDLVLSKVEEVCKHKRVVGVSKHLCGGATDLALRCLVSASEAGTNVAGLIMTFCCHHRCDWNAFVAKKFFEDLGLAANDFDTICRLVSWAVCGTGMSRERRNLQNEPSENERNAELGLNRKEKAEIGRKCKDLLNWGRKTYLEECGFKCYLHYYVKSEISLENVCIVAIKNK